MADEILAFSKWPTNGHLIAAAAKLGYIKGVVLDATYGKGTFWKEWCPPDNALKSQLLVTNDLDPTTEAAFHFDFTDLPWVDEFFDTVVFDGPYKLNGTPDPMVDARYGVGQKARWQDRMALLVAGTIECARVCRSTLLIKCQDQVCSGKVRWQSYELTKLAEECGFGLVDRFDFESYRPQPGGTSQKHARRNTSQLLVFKRGHSS